MQRTSTRRLLRRGYKSARTSATYGTGGSTGAAERFPCPVRNSRAQRYGSRPRPSGCDGGRGRGNIALHLDRTDLAASGLSGKIRIDSDRGTSRRRDCTGRRILTSPAAKPRGGMSGSQVILAWLSTVGGLDLDLVGQHVRDRSRRLVLISGFARASSPTHPRIFTAPSSLAEAMEVAEDLRTRPNRLAVSPGPDH